jgi:TPR repeat protein
MSTFSRLFSTIAVCTLGATPVLADIEAGIAALEQSDVETAARQFQASFEGGNPDGAFYLGRMFELGLGTEPNLTRAAELYMAAASQDSALALNRLGLMYFNGEVVIRDYVQGADYICRAAEKGEINAQFSCGAAYNEGKGVEKDLSKARDY